MIRKIVILSVIVTVLILIYSSPVKADFSRGWMECEIVATQSWYTSNDNYRAALKLTEVNGTFENTWIELIRDKNVSHFLALSLTAISADKNLEVRIIESEGIFYINAVRLLN